jgi:hypothetical protein
MQRLMIATVLMWSARRQEDPVGDRFSRLEAGTAREAPTRSNELLNIIIVDAVRRALDLIAASRLLDGKSWIYYCGRGRPEDDDGGQRGANDFR